MEFINYVHIRGIVGRVNKTPMGNKTACRISVVTNRTFINHTGNHLLESTWFNVTAFLESDSDTLEKIKREAWVDVEGRFRLQRFTKESGEEGVTYEIVSDKLTIIDAE